MKYFCPWCALELESNQAGAAHKNPNAAWMKMECEYQVGDFSAGMPKNYPVSELECEIERLVRLEQSRVKIIDSIKAANERIAQLQRDVGIVATSEVNNEVAIKNGK